MYRFMELKIELIILHFVVKNLHNRISTVFSQTQLITNYLEKIFEFCFLELLTYLPFFKEHFKKSLVLHIPHKYSAEMSKKSEVVSK